MVVDWDDDNNTVDSRFELPETRTLAGGQFYGSTNPDGGILRIIDVDQSTGEISYTVERVYQDDGKAESTFNPATPDGNATAFDVSTVIVTSTDEEGECASNTDGFDLTVSNVAPVLTNVTVTPGTINENGTVTLTGNIVDPGKLDAFQLVVSWGDGKGDTITLPAGSTSFTLTHVYDAGGNYTIGLTLVDDDLGVARVLKSRKMITPLRYK